MAKSTRKPLGYNQRQDEIDLLRELRQGFAHTLNRFAQVSTFPTANQPIIDGFLNLLNPKNETSIRTVREYNFLLNKFKEIFYDSTMRQDSEKIPVNTRLEELTALREKSEKPLDPTQQKDIEILEEIESTLASDAEDLKSYLEARAKSYLDAFKNMQQKLYDINKQFNQCLKEIKPELHEQVTKLDQDLSAQIETLAPLEKLISDSKAYVQCIDRTLNIPYEAFFAAFTREMRKITNEPLRDLRLNLLLTNDLPAFSHRVEALKLHQPSSKAIREILLIESQLNHLTKNKEDKLEQHSLESLHNLYEGLRVRVEQLEQSILHKHSLFSLFHKNVAKSPPETKPPVANSLKST